MATTARPSRTPNYDSLHPVHRRRINAKVMQTIGARNVPRGVRVYERDPGDIDLFRELYAIEHKAKRLQETLEDLADNRDGRQKRFDAAKDKAIRQVGQQFIHKMGFFGGTKPPKRREYATAALEAHRIQF